MASPTPTMNLESTIPFMLDATYTPAPAASSTIASPSTTSTQPISRLSSSAALGIGFAAGVLSTLLLITASFLCYRSLKLRQSSVVRYHEQARAARLWRGFTPATPNPNTARTTLVEEKMKDIYFTQIRSPVFTLTLSPSGQAQGSPLTDREPDGERVV